MSEQPCGRIDDHDEHDWSRPANAEERIRLGVRRFYYKCLGPPVYGTPTKHKK